MNAAGRRAIQDAISSVEDNLYRYQLGERATPGATTGNGESYQSVIAGLERERAELQAALAEAEA